MVFLLMYNLKFSESASKKFARPPKFAQNPNGGSYVAPLTLRRRIVQICTIDLFFVKKLVKT